MIKCPKCECETEHYSTCGVCAADLDGPRLDKLHNILMQLGREISNAIGLPYGWTDIREALDNVE